MLSVVAVAGAAYGVLALYLFLHQASMVFLPEVGRDVRTTPDRVGLAWEAVEVPTADGLVLEAWYVHPRADRTGPPRATVLMLHGNAGNLSHRIPYAQVFASSGYATLLASYRGYARNPGAPSEEGLYRDAEAAWAWLTGTRGVDPRDIVVVGESLGGGPASWLAARTEAAALILIATFASLPDLAEELYPFLPARALARIRFDNAANVGKLRMPLLVVHSRGDRFIAFSHAERLVAASGSRGRLLEVAGDHNDMFLNDARSREAVTAFIDRHVAGKRVEP